MAERDGRRGAGGRPRIGVISDTHGYLDPRVPKLFRGVTHIIHAGDVVDGAILGALEAVAPLTAVSGNVDGDELAASLPSEVTGEIAGVHFVVGHKRKRLMKRLAAGRYAVGPDGAPPDLVVFGHDHVPAAAWIDGTLFLNPGTASSPDEEDDGPTVAIVEVVPTGLSVRFVPLERSSRARRHRRSEPPAEERKG
jgi:uncharacterized protein